MENKSETLDKTSKSNRKLSIDYHLIEINLALQVIIFNLEKTLSFLGSNLKDVRKQ